MSKMHPQRSRRFPSGMLLALKGLVALIRYGTHLKQANLNPNFFRQVEVVDDASHLFQRLRQTHDISHIITGFGIDGLGEMELKAFEYAQTRRPMAVVLIGLVIWIFQAGESQLSSTSVMQGNTSIDETKINCLV